MTAHYLLVGRVSGAHGVRGDVRLSTFTADPLAIVDYRELIRADGTLALTVLSARIAKGGVIARCKGIETKEQADALKGLSLHIARSALPEPDEDEFYLADLIGLAAVNPEGQRIGRVKSVQDFGAGDILEIDPAEGGPTWYLPFTREAVPDVRISAGQIIIVRPDEVEWVPETGADPDETPQD
jgi:16S rRNA processing protein RimM